MQPAAYVLLVAILGVLLTAARRHQSFTTLPWQVLTRWLNGISAITLILAVTTAGMAGALTVPGSSPAAAAETTSQDLPDIYLVLLDGYPRSDTLTATYHFDNEPVLAEMGDLGFEVARRSHSNYNLTVLTLASMLNMEHVGGLPELSDPPSSAAGQYRSLTRAIVRARAFDVLGRTRLRDRVDPVTVFRCHSVLSGSRSR